MNTFFLTIGILACWFGIMANLLAVSAINKPRSGVFWNWVYRTLCDPIKGDYYCAHFPHINYNDLFYRSCYLSMILPKIKLRFEKWKFNKDYGVYVSTLGNFKDRYKKNTPIKINQNGYCVIKTEARPSGVLAHRLVMLTWRSIANAEQLTVDHLNHNKRDNSLDNLEWVTTEENRKRANRDRISGGGNKIDLFNIPLTTYQATLIGFKLKDKFCMNEEDVWQAMKFYGTGLSEQEVKSRARLIIEKFKLRDNIDLSNLRCGLSITRRKPLVPVFKGVEYV